MTNITYIIHADNGAVVNIGAEYESVEEFDGDVLTDEDADSIFPDFDVATVDKNDFISLTSDQRKTLFGLFSTVFGGRSREARREFTRKVLDTTSEDLSWSSSDVNGGSITVNEADRLIDVLKTIQRIFDIA